MIEETFGKLVFSANDAWMHLIEDVYRNGQYAHSRGRETMELLGRSVVVDMAKPIVSNKARRIGYNFMLAEAAWIILGKNDVKSIAPFSAKISYFSDDGIYFQGAYGPQIVQQLPYIISCFKKDLFTRQAVISIWKPSPPDSKDIPCTITCQFMVRANLLHAFVNMRSSDCWLGVPYDWFNFSMLAKYVTLILNETIGSTVDLGFLHFNAASQHIYTSDFPGIVECISHTDVEESPIEYITEISNAPDFILNLRQALLNGPSK